MSTPLPRPRLARRLQRRLIALRMQLEADLEMRASCRGRSSGDGPSSRRSSRRLSAAGPLRAGRSRRCARLRAPATACSRRRRRLDPFPRSCGEHVAPADRRPAAAILAGRRSLRASAGPRRSDLRSGPVGTLSISPHQSGALPFTGRSCVETTRSGVPISQLLPSSNLRGGGMSAGLPRGAPLSAHLPIVATSASLSDGSSLYLWMPTFFSMYHGGITPRWGPMEVRCLIARAYGRTSS